MAIHGRPCEPPEDVTIRRMPPWLWRELGKVARRRGVPRQELVVRLLAEAVGFELDDEPNRETWVD